MRIRSIKPEFWKSEDIARLPHRTRLTFIALWSYVDDNGVGRDVPQLITGEVFALEPDPREALANVREDLATLSEEGRIVRYAVEGKPYLSITNFDRHQRIDKPNKPRYPEADDPAAVLTCGYGDSRETVATYSRESRETPAPGAVEVGTGEQGIRGVPSSTAVAVPAADPGQVVAAFVEGAIGNGLSRPGPRIIGQVAKTATALLGQGQDPSSLLVAARRLGANGWDNLEREVRRVEAEQRPQQSPTKPSTTDAKVASTLALAARFADRDNARDSA